MKNLMLTALFLTLGVATYSQNNTSPLQSHSKKNIINESVVINQSGMKSSVFLLSLECNLKSKKLIQETIKTKDIAILDLQSKAFFKTFFGRSRKLIRLA